MSACFGYVRVSSKKQEEGTSLEVQRELIEGYCKREKIEIMDWFSESVTAAKQGRPEFSRMLKLLKKGKADGIVLHKVDRSARNLQDWTNLMKLVDLGYEVHLAQEGLNVNSRMTRLSANIQAIVAIDYIENLRQESRKGFYGRLRQGLWPLKAPIGYVDNGEAKPKTVHRKKGPLVQEMFALYASGKYTLVTICETMTKLGLRNHAGNPIKKTGASRILRNPFYTGLMEVKTTGETFNGVHEPLITQELFDSVQDVLDGKKRKVNTVHDYTYRKLFRCGACGTTMIGERQKGHIYYRCHTRDCPTKCVRERELEAAMLDWLRKIELLPKEYDTAISVVEQFQNTQAEISDEVIERLKLESAAISTKLGKLTDLVVEGMLDTPAYAEKRKTLLVDQAKIKEKQRQIEESPNWISTRATEVLELAKTASLSYQSANTERKRQLAELTTSNRTVTGGKVSIEPQNPFGMLTSDLSVPHCGQSSDLPRTYSQSSCTNKTRSLETMVNRLIEWAKTAHLASNDN